MKNICFYILISVIAGSCGNRTPESRPEPPLRVKVAEITTEYVSIPVRSTGLLSAADELKLSFKTGGIIAAVNAREGDRVKKGNLLAALDLSEIRAASEQARNGYEKALRDLRRVENLYRDSVVTLEQKQNATTALDVAKSTWDVARFNLDHSRITAPDNGIILKQLARKNELVAPGYPVFLFGSSGKHWKIRASLSDRDVVKINPGDSAIVHFDAWPGVRFAAVVDRTGGMSNPYTGTFETEILLKDNGYRLVAGFVAGIEILPVNRRRYTSVPVQSIVEADELNGYVYAVTDSMTARKIKVTIENLADSTVAVSGIPGDVNEVVTEGAAWLRHGARVTIVKE